MNETLFMQSATVYYSGLAGKPIIVVFYIRKCIIHSAVNFDHSLISSY